MCARYSNSACSFREVDSIHRPKAKSDDLTSGIVDFILFFPRFVPYGWCRMGRANMHDQFGEHHYRYLYLSILQYIQTKDCIVWLV